MKAADHLSDRIVCDTLSDWVRKLADNYQELPHIAVGGGFRQRWRDDQALRKQVVGRILDQRNVDFLGLVMNNYLVFAEDLRWVLHEAEEESDTEKKKRWAKLASHFPYCDHQQIVMTSFSDPVVRRKFMERIEAPTDLSAEAARDAFRKYCSEREKKRAEWETKREKKAAKRKQAQLSPQQVLAILAHSENRGAVAVWHATFRAMLTRQWNDDTSGAGVAPVRRTYLHLNLSPTRRGYHAENTPSLPSGISGSYRRTGSCRTFGE